MCFGRAAATDPSPGVCSGVAVAYVAQDAAAGVLARRVAVLPRSVRRVAVPCFAVGRAKNTRELLRQSEKLRGLYERIKAVAERKKRHSTGDCCRKCRPATAQMKSANLKAALAENKAMALSKTKALEEKALALLAVRRLENQIRAAS